MAHTEVVFYKDVGRGAPVLDWLSELRCSDRRGYAKCVARLHRLAELGHELRRPEAAHLRDGIYELRIRRGRLNYRILYFFHGPGVAVLAGGLSKADRIPRMDLYRAITRKAAFERDPRRHTLELELSDDG